MTQGQKLFLGLLKLKETYETLRVLDFSNNILNEIYDIIEDLEDLIKNEKGEN